MFIEAINTCLCNNNNDKKNPESKLSGSLSLRILFPKTKEKKMILFCHRKGKKIKDSLNQIECK